MICMQRSAHSCEICVELLAGISVLEYAFCTRHNSPRSTFHNANNAAAAATATTPIVVTVLIAVIISI